MMRQLAPIVWRDAPRKATTKFLARYVATLELLLMDAGSSDCHMSPHACAISFPMTSERFLAGLTGHDNDFPLVAEALKAAGEPFCLIGGLAVNHYVEPVVTLDADFAVAGHAQTAQALYRERGFEVEEHPHSLNAQLPGSRLRVQVTLDARYRTIPRSRGGGRGLRSPSASRRSGRPCARQAVGAG